MKLEQVAEQALSQLRKQGFDHAQVSVCLNVRDEVNFALNEPSLLRSNESQTLSLTGIVDGGKASTETSDLRAEAIERLVEELYSNALAAPRDEANAVSEGQSSDIVQGPQQADVGLLADKIAELLAYRAEEAPLVTLEEGFAAHLLSTRRVLTSAGSELSTQIGWYSLSASGTGKEGEATSSFNYAGGDCNDLETAHAAEFFGIGNMLHETQKQIHASPVGGNFVGDVVLSPYAVYDVLGWLQTQLGDTHLIAGSSLYRDRVGEIIASPLLSVRSRFDAPGVAAVTGDAFAAADLDMVRDGRLQVLLPSLYGSRKTGVKHTPSLNSGWEVEPGQTGREQLLGDVQRGALVGRLSMGSPTASGDFSGIIKNSFRIDSGEVGSALSETMIAGNMAKMLNDIVAISREQLDTGSELLPWIRINGLNFS